jgi:hypothetical protein
VGEALDPTGSPIVVGDVTLVTPGLAGVAESHLPGTPGLRAAEELSPRLQELLVAADLEVQETIEISEAEEIDLAPATAGEGLIEVTVPDAGESWGQLVLAADESGVLTWSFAPPAAHGPLLRGEASRTYYVRSEVPPSAGQSATSRGVIGAIGTKLLKVLAFKLLDRAAGEVSDYFAARWEAANRPYRLRRFSPSDHTRPDPAPLTDDDWQRMRGGRALLLLHGPFGQTHTTFSGLPVEIVQALHERYDHRVFAFDHFTLSDDPRRNVEILLSQLPDDVSLELDVLSHSRGGLVARALAERESEIALGGSRVAVRRVAFVGAPNAGTVLADAAHFGDLVDTFTNVLNFFPDTGVVEVLQMVIAVVKQLAVGALKGLDGLTAMSPGGAFLSALNAPVAATDAEYLSLSSDLHSHAAGLADWARGAAITRIFSGAANDLVVPALGAYEANGSGAFPIAQHLVLRGDEAVAHTHYFSSPVVGQKLQEWLTGA